METYYTLSGPNGDSLKLKHEGFLNKLYTELKNVINITYYIEILSWIIYLLTEICKILKYATSE